MKQRPRRARTDQATRELVDQAIAAVPKVGIRGAAEFLAAMHVEPGIAARALVYPRRRRATEH